MHIHKNGRYFPKRLETYSLIHFCRHAKKQKIRKKIIHLRPPSDGLNGKKIMKIEIEMKETRFIRLRNICRQICNTYRRYPHQELGRSTIYDLTKADTMILEDLIHAITESEFETEFAKRWL